MKRHMLIIAPVIVLGLVLSFQNCARPAAFIQDPEFLAAASQSTDGSGIIGVWAPGDEIKVAEGSSVNFVNIPMNPFDQAVSVSWEVVGASSRLAAASGTFAVNAGATSINQTLTALTDSLVQGDKSYTMVFRRNGVIMPDLERKVTVLDRTVLGGGSGGSGGTTPAPIVYPKVSFAAPTCQAGNLCKVYVSLSKAMDQTVKFNWKTNDTAYQNPPAGVVIAQPNVNYVPVQTVVTFPAGSTMQTIDVQSIAGSISLIQIPYIWSACSYGSSTVSCDVYK